MLRKLLKMSSKILIDGKEYDTEALTPNIKAQIDMILGADQKINELNRDLAMCMTARNTYAKALNELLSAEIDD
jgi:hypothetical protein